MNTPGLFIIGAIVTLVVALALGLLVYGAILDGREQRRRDRALAVRGGLGGEGAATGHDG